MALLVWARAAPSRRKRRCPARAETEYFDSLEADTRARERAKKQRVTDDAMAFKAWRGRGSFGILPPPSPVPVGTLHMNEDGARRITARPSYRPRS
jgi:hypothetical protein